MITVTGLIELDECNGFPYVSVRYKRNVSWDECLEEAKSVYEFGFEYDKKTDLYQFVSLKKITKAKARKNPQ